MMVSMVFATAAFVGCVSLFVKGWALGLSWGNDGLWLSFYAFLVTRAVALALQRGRIVEKATPEPPVIVSLPSAPLKGGGPQYQRVYGTQADV
jgi:hypothetical protein